MTKNPIETGWQTVLKDNDGFCCESCRDAFRIMYFAGAMAAMNAVTGWDPEAPHILCVSLPEVARVRDELTAAYHAEQAMIDLVRQ